MTKLTLKMAILVIQRYRALLMMRSLICRALELPSWTKELSRNPIKSINFMIVSISLHNFKELHSSQSLFLHCFCNINMLRTRSKIKDRSSAQWLECMPSRTWQQEENRYSRTKRHNREYNKWGNSQMRRTTETQSPSPFSTHGQNINLMNMKMVASPQVVANTVSSIPTNTSIGRPFHILNAIRWMANNIKNMISQ